MTENLPKVEPKIEPTELELLQSIDKSVATIRGMMTFFLILFIIALVAGGCSVLTHL